MTAVLPIAASRIKRQNSMRFGELNRFRLRKNILVFACSLILCSCNNWPPKKTWLKANLAENRDAFSSLEAKIVETDYERVSRSIGETVRADPVIGGFDQRVFIRDDPSWGVLLRRASVFFVARDEELFVFGMGESPFKGDRTGFVSYRHAPFSKPELKPCLPRHKKIACGRCVAEIGKDWFLDYAWWPEPILPVEYDAYLNGQMSDDEYFRLQDNALTKCTADGYAEIGYKIERLD